MYYLAFSFTITIIGLMFPYGVPLFGTLLIVQFIYLIYTKNKIIIFSKYFMLFYLNIILFLVVQLYTVTVYNNIVHYLINLITIVIFHINFLNIIKTKEEFNKFYCLIKKYIFYSATFISTIGLYKFKLLFKGIKIDFFRYDTYYPHYSSLVRDYNYSSLGLILAVLFGYSLMNLTKNIFLKFIILFSINIILINIILSGSRRGLVFVCLLLFIWILKSIFSKYSFNKTTVKNKLHYIVLVVIILTGLQFSTFEFNTQENNKYNSIIKRAKSILDASKTNGSLSERTIRWDYAYQLANQYSISEIFFGRGYHYIALFGKKFHVSTNEGRPHNIVISYFLSSGLVGLLLFLLLQYYCIKLYFKYYHIIPEMFIFYLIATIFALLSDDFIFSVKIYTISIILPFFIHKIYKEDNEKNI